MARPKFERHPALGGLRLRTLTLAAFTILLTAAIPPAEAQTQQPQGFKACGITDELVLVFLNPDLSKIDESGYGHASGKFFVQFQARGPKAMEIDKLYFSFGKPAGSAVCDAAEWYTEGAFIKNYRADFDWKDGFFVPINTLNVPDGEYIAALSAYSATGTELVRYWAKYKVENGCTRLGCQPAEYVEQDKILPWPMILPGDGIRTDGKAGLYIEVGEPVKEVKAWLGTHDGQKLLELTNATPPLRDDDPFPDVPSSPTGEPTTLECAGVDPQTTNFCAKQWGMAWEWPGVIGDEAVIRVRLVDLNGNVGEKVVHVGDPTIGGRVSGGAPELQFDIPEVAQSTDSEGRAVWNVTYKSLADDGVHGDVFLHNLDGSAIAAPFTGRVQPNHVMMGGHEERTGTVTIVAGPDATPGSYEFQLVVNYLAGEARVEKATGLKLQVVDRASGNADQQEQIASTAGETVEGTRGEKLTSTNASSVVPEEAPKDSPSAGALLVGAALAVAGVLATRRRR